MFKKKYLSEKEMEDSSIIGECIFWDDLDCKNFNNISDLKEYLKDKKINSYNYGDLVSFSTYRDTRTMFIGKNGKLVRNPDYTGAGYLTIPYEITQYLKNATNKYKDIDYTYIDLRHDDDLLEHKISKNLNPEYKYFYDPCEEIIFVNYPNNAQGEFDLNSTSLEDIEAFYEGSKKEQSHIKVFYELRNFDMEKFKVKYGSSYKLPSIPKTWKAHLGSSAGGSNYTNGNVHFNGPTESMAEVIEKINIFYEGFNFKITV